MGSSIFMFLLSVRPAIKILAVSPLHVLLVSVRPDPMGRWLGKGFTQYPTEKTLCTVLIDMKKPIREGLETGKFNKAFFK